MAFAPATALEYLRRAHAGGRLGHAYLLVGAEPAFELARELVAAVVHTKPSAALKHPDVYVVEPESKSRRIVVEQVRELESSLRLRASTSGGRKVGILREADRLQPQASNAFLKTLEEPPAGSLLLLLSAQPESMMETILSRCIKVTLQPPAGGEAPASAPDESALLDLLTRHANERRAEAEAASIPTAYRLLREFTGLLAAARARIQAEADAALAREDKHYGQTTDGTWLAEREGYYKSITEARYVAGRARLVETLARWWGDALRRQATGQGGPGQDGEAREADILRRLAAIDALRENLDRNIQEALALEVAFLQVFAS